MQAQAQPTILSTTPISGATGVSTTAAVVFTFSEAMDTNATTAMLYSTSPYALLTTTPVWSAGNTVLSCTPNPAFPASTLMIWFVSGQDPDGDTLSGIPEGTFTTGTGSGGGGGGNYGTNQSTAFTIGQAIIYDQTSSAAPTLDINMPPYLFFAAINLSSNQSALSATLELPSTSVSNLVQNMVESWQYLLSVSSSSQTTFTNTFGNGNYIFNVVAATSNELVTVNLPATLVQPGAPVLANYPGTQSVNPAQPFTLSWNSFAGGTAADYIYVNIGSAFTTSPPETSNALSGTATSVQIPANTLQPGSNYDSFVSFYHVILKTNLATNYTTLAYRCSTTEFNLITTSATTTPMILTNATKIGHTFSFNVTSAAGQSLVIQFNTNNTLNPSQWQTLLSTNSATGVVQVNDSVNATNPFVIYRAQSGP